MLTNLRAELAQIDSEAAIHLLNGMFFEVFFNKNGEFRVITELKSRFLDKLVLLQSIKKFEPSILFIRRALQPYRNNLAFLPALKPEIIEFVVTIKKGAPPLVKSIQLGGRELLSEAEDESLYSGITWKLSLSKFTIDKLKRVLCESFSIPSNQIMVSCNLELAAKAEYRRPENYILLWPE